MESNQEPNVVALHTNSTVIQNVIDIRLKVSYFLPYRFEGWMTYMKTDYLHEVWGAPDNSRLVSKQFSFRLPVHIAAKIAALGEMYPTKNRTQIVADLLTVALDDLEKNLPQARGRYLEPHEDDPEPKDSYQLGGVRARFRNLANKHYLELEKELGNATPEPLFRDLYLPSEDFEK
jgi:hypothetical protein